MKTAREIYYKLANIPVLGSLCVYVAPVFKRLFEKKQFRKKASLEERLAMKERRCRQLRLQLKNLMAENKRNFPLASVIVCTNGRPEFARQILGDILRQNYPFFEVIFVLGPDRAQTEKLLTEAKGDIEILYCDEMNISKSRNIGIKKAKGELLAFLDDDVRVAHDWLFELLTPFADQKISAVGGFIRDCSGKTWQSRVTISDRFGDIKYYSSSWAAEKVEGSPDSWGKRQFYSPTGTNMAIRKNAIMKIGGFDEAYTWHLDETDVMARLTDAGESITFSEQAEIIHLKQPQKRQSWDSLEKRAESKERFIKTHAVPVYGEEQGKKRFLAYKNYLKIINKLPDDFRKDCS